MESRDIKFLIDVGVGKKVEDFLSNEGFNVKAVRDINSKMKDKEVLDLAVFENRMIITMDKDFGELVYKSKLTHNGILVLRIEDANIGEKIKIVSGIISNYLDEIKDCFCIFYKGKLRIRGK
jgi:predicted nuclease of predicted toxin-antitoxin system